VGALAPTSYKKEKSMPNSETITRSRIAIKTDIKEPNLYRVIYVNDNVTSFEFVISSLIEVFNYDVTAAQMKAEQIHLDGHSVIAVLPYEVAEQKTLEVLTLAQLSGYPLVVKVEPEL
jgi:ATP-dependent Clp protease adaptor protein ClpS